MGTGARGTDAGIRPRLAGRVEAVMDFRCDKCRLIWQEDRSKGDSPISPHAFACPRCGRVTAPKAEARKGLAIVGESGPETVPLPRGSGIQ